LKERIDPRKKIQYSLRTGESHVKRMIEEAGKLHWDSERCHAADEIRLAGNDAIHNLPAFKRGRAHKTRKNLDDLRKALEDLYR
jgi:hypothetical protein